MIEVFTSYTEGRATLNFVAASKEWSIFFECEHQDHAAPIVWDFAAFACLAIADRYKQQVCLHAPVTHTAMENCRKLSEYFRIMDGAALTYEVRSEKIVADHNPQGEFRSLCVSTGMDSTYILATEYERHQFTHGLVVHGADYPVHESDGFGALFARVTNMCKKSSLSPVVVATNLREINYDWGKLHVAQLAACMHFLGPKFSDVAFAADNTIAQDLLRAPWGNNFYVGTHISGGTCTAHYLGYEVDRYQKIKAIQKDSKYIDDIGVCFSDPIMGWNCGTCYKCIQTRIALESNGEKVPNIFREMPDIVDVLNAIKIGKNKHAAVGIGLRTNELIPHAKDPEIKNALIRLHKRAQNPPRFSQRTRRRITVFVLTFIAILYWLMLR